MSEWLSNCPLGICCLPSRLANLSYHLNLCLSNSSVAALAVLASARLAAVPIDPPDEATAREDALQLSTLADSTNPNCRTGTYNVAVIARSADGVALVSTEADIAGSLGAVEAFCGSRRDGEEAKGGSREGLEVHCRCLVVECERKTLAVRVLLLKADVEFYPCGPQLGLYRRRWSPLHLLRLMRRS